MADLTSHDEEIAAVRSYVASVKSQLESQPVSGWHPYLRAFSELAEIQKAFEAGEMSNALAYRKALKQLQPLLGNEAAKALIFSAGWDRSEIKISAVRRPYWQTSIERLMRISHSLECVGLAIMIRIREGDTLPKAFENVAGRRLGEFASGFDDDHLITHSEFTLADKWAEWRREAVARGFADVRVFRAVQNDTPIPNDAIWLDDLPRSGRPKNRG